MLFNHLFVSVGTGELYIHICIILNDTLGICVRVCVYVCVCALEVLEYSDTCLCSLLMSLVQAACLHGVGFGAAMQHELSHLMTEYSLIWCGH